MQGKNDIHLRFASTRFICQDPATAVKEHGDGLLGFQYTELRTLSCLKKNPISTFKLKPRSRLNIEMYSDVKR